MKLEPLQQLLPFQRYAALKSEVVRTLIFRNAAYYSINCIVTYGESKIYITQSSAKKLYGGFNLDEAKTPDNYAVII